jgi:AcrR family transcriptional regulator
MSERSFTIGLTMRAAGVKARIDRTAVDLFAAKGVDGVSIAEIAAAADVSQGALYRHYRSKDELAERLFSLAYRRTGAELTVLVRAEIGFAARVGAMVTHFCALYDHDAALFRFMLIAQHDLLPRINGEDPTPVAVIETAIVDAITDREIGAVDPVIAAATIMGIVLQTALFHVYDRITGPLSPHAPALTRAAIAAVTALP